MHGFEIMDWFISILPELKGASPKFEIYSIFEILIACMGQFSAASLLQPSSPTSACFALAFASFVISKLLQIAQQLSHPMHLFWSTSTLYFISFQPLSYFL
jgi:hypothetical protein